MKLFTLVALLLVPLFSEASVKVFNSSGKDLGHFNDIQCGPNLTCEPVAGKALISSNQPPQVTAASGTTQLTTAQCGSTVVNTGAATFVLPSISDDGYVGCQYKFVVGAAAAMSIDPATAQEQILLLTNAGGDLISADAQGESVVLEAIIGGLNPKWAPIGAEKGTWTDGN